MSTQGKVAYLKSYSSHAQSRPRQHLTYLPKQPEPAAIDTRPHVKSSYLIKRSQKIQHSQPGYQRLLKAYSSLRARYASPSHSNFQPSPNRKYSLRNIAPPRQHTPENKNSPSSPYKHKHKNIETGVKYNSPLNSLTLNKPDKTHKKLTLDRDTTKKDNRGLSVVSEVQRQMAEITKNFKKALALRQDKGFLSQLANSFNCQALTQIEGKDKSLVECIGAIVACLKRKQSISVEAERIKLGIVNQEMQQMRVELNKKTIRLNLDQRALEKEKEKNRQLEKDYGYLMERLEGQRSEKGVGTDGEPLEKNLGETMEWGTNEANNIKSFYQNEMMQAEKEGIDKLKRKLMAYRRRDKDLVKLFAVLRSEGIQIEKVYEDVVAGRMQVSVESSRKVKDNLNHIRKEEKEMYKRCREEHQPNQCDADESIVSDAQGLGFSWREKSLSVDQFTPRQNYQAPALQAKMQQKLLLDFDALYEEEAFESDEEHLIPDVHSGQGTC